MPWRLASAEAVTSTTPPSAGPAVSPSAESSSKSADHTMSATWDGSAVHTWHSAPMSMRTDSACATSIGSSGHRRIGRVSPTCTGIDKMARMAAGSSSNSAVVTSTTTAPGPAYDAAARTVNVPSPVTAASSLVAGEAHMRFFNVNESGPPEGLVT